MVFIRKIILRVALTVAVLPVIAACASGPTFDASREPAVATGLTRIYFYRINPTALAFSGIGFQKNISVDGTPVGSMLPGGYFYVDKPPGNYEISTTSEGEKEAARITVKPGEPRYIRFDLTVGTFQGHLVPAPVSAELGKTEIAKCHYDPVAP